MLTVDQQAEFIGNFVAGQYRRHDPDAPPVRISDLKRPGFREGHAARYTAYPASLALEVLRSRGDAAPEDILDRMRWNAVTDDLERPTPEDIR